jgi:hypothetical protein
MKLQLHIYSSIDHELLYIGCSTCADVYVTSQDADGGDTARGVMRRERQRPLQVLIHLRHRCKCRGLGFHHRSMHCATADKGSRRPNACRKPIVDRQEKGTSQLSRPGSRRCTHEFDDEASSSNQRKNTSSRDVGGWTKLRGDPHPKNVSTGSSSPKRMCLAYNRSNRPGK